MEERIDLFGCDNLCPDLLALEWMEVPASQSVPIYKKTIKPKYPHDGRGICHDRVTSSIRGGEG